MAGNITDVFPNDIEVELEDDKSKILFPRLDLDDLTSWCDQLHTEWKAKQTALLPKSLKPLEEYQAKRAIEFGAPNLDDIADLCYKPKGIKEALRRSLRKKVAKTDDEAFAIIRRIKPARAQNLAQEVSSLFTKAPQPAPKSVTDPSNEPKGKEEGPPPPNEDSGANQTGSVPPLDRKDGGTESTNG